MKSRPHISCPAGRPRRTRKDAACCRRPPASGVGARHTPWLWFRASGVGLWVAGCGCGCGCECGCTAVLEGTTTCEERTASAPMSAPGPTRHPAPTTAPASSAAAGSTIAEGWIFAVACQRRLSPLPDMFPTAAALSPRPSDPHPIHARRAHDPRNMSARKLGRSAADSSAASAAPLACRTKRGELAIDFCLMASRCSLRSSRRRWRIRDPGTPGLLRPCRRNQRCREGRRGRCSVRTGVFDRRRLAGSLPLASDPLVIPCSWPPRPLVCGLRLRASSPTTKQGPTLTVRANSRSPDSDLPCGRPQKPVAVKNVVGLQVGVSSTKKCVQHVSRGRDHAGMVFWRKKNDHGVVTRVISD